MRPKYRTFHVPPGPQALAAGLTFLSEWPGAQDGVIVTSTKKQFTASMLADVIGARGGAALAAGREIAVGTRRVRGATLNTFRSLRWNGGPILALWLDEKNLRVFDDARSIEALCVVPWVADEITSWIKATGAIDLLNPTQPPPPATIGDPVVLEAMRWLTGGVNLATGLAHPLDRARVVGVFRVLKEGRHAWAPDEVYVWAVANGWKTEHAGDLRDVSDRIAAGRNVHVRDRAVVSESYLDLWRTRAAEEADPEP